MTDRFMYLKKGAHKHDIKCKVDAGALLYFGYHYRVYLSAAMRSEIIPILILNLLIGFATPGIDNFAHIGGLIGGVLVSRAIGVKYKSTMGDIINGIIMTLIFVGFLSYMAFMR